MKASTHRGRITPKQKRFVEQYLIDLNGTQAAIRSGYSPRTARFHACDLLTKPNIQSAIQEAQQQRSERTQIKADRVLQEEALLAFSDIRKLFDKDGRLISPSELPEEVTRTIAIFEVIETVDKDGTRTTRYKCRLWNKGDALGRVERHLGMYDKDSLNLNNTGGVEIVINPEDRKLAEDLAQRFLKEKHGRHNL